MKLFLLLTVLSTVLSRKTSFSLQQTRPRDSDEKNAQAMTLFLEGFIFGFLGDDANEIKACTFDT